MPYFDQYKSRVLAYGNTEQDRMESKLKRDFQALVRKSADKTVFTYEGVEYLGILSSGARSAAQSENKIIFYLYGPKEKLLPEGAVITTWDRGYQKNRLWIVMNQEVHPYYGYFKYKMLELDYILKYIGSDGKQHSIPCYINGTGTFDIKEYFKFSNRNTVKKPNRALNCVWATTNDITDDCTFIIGKETWKFVDDDRISIPGVSYSTLNYIGIDESQDSIDEQIAGTMRLDSINIISNYGSGDEEEISINDEFTNLQFFLLNDGRIEKASFSYEISDGFALLDNDKFELLGNDGSITVTDNITGFSKKFEFIIDQIQDYCYIIGNSKVDVFSTNYFTLNTDYENLSIEFDTDLLTAAIQKDNTIKVTTKSKLGNTSIIIKSGNQEVGSIDLTIGSSWR